MASAKSEVKVKSLQKALTILDCFTDKQPLSITEISERLGLYKSNVYDILSTFTAMGYLSKSEESGKYYLGMNAVRLGRAAGERYSFQNIAAARLEQLAESTGEIAYLTVPLGYQVYYLNTAFPKNNISAHTVAMLYNSSEPMHLTSSGKAMLSRMSQSFVDEYLSMPLARATEYSITDPGLIREELARIRMRGYAIDDQENAIGLRCVGVPIVDKSGDVLGAISVSGPIMHFTKDKIESFAKLLLEQACEITNNL